MLGQCAQSSGPPARDGFNLIGRTKSRSALPAYKQSMRIQWMIVLARLDFGLPCHNPKR